MMEAPTPEELEELEALIRKPVPETPVQERLHELVRRARLADDDLGYPNGAAFVPGDETWTDDAVWEDLHEDGQAVVLVTMEHEILLCPRRRSLALRWLDGVLHTTPVLMSTRKQGSAEFPPAARMRIGRRTCRRLRTHFA
jgi:hypothetical protein